MAAPKNNCFNPNGAPEKPIDFKKFEDLCSLWCTSEEIAAMLDVHLNTLKKHVCRHYKCDDYSQIYKKFFNYGLPSFRRERRVLAKKNATMSIYLGKIHLGEVEATDEKASPKDALNELEHRVMFLNYENERLRKELDNKCQARSELCGSDTQVQHLGGSDQSRQDILQHPSPDL